MLVLLPGGTLGNSFMGLCRPVPQILTLFQNEKCYFLHPFSDLVQVVGKVDSAIRQINHYAADNAFGFCNTCPLDSDFIRWIARFNF